MKVYPQHIKRFLPELNWNIEELATNLSMIGHETDTDGESLEVKVFPNRGDVLSLRGLSRDLAALYPAVGEWRDVEVADLPAQKDFYPLTIDEGVQDIVWSDHLIKIENYRPTDSPVEVAELLRPLGLQPKNLIIDLTNIVMYEVGAPLHVFDFDKVSNGLEITLSREDEPFLPLASVADHLPKTADSDRVEIFLHADMLIQRTNDVCVDLMGVTGGQKSKVDNSTHTVLLQCAAIEPKRIRKNSRLIKSPASYRYERGVDPALCRVALGRFLFYINKYAPDSTVVAYQQWGNEPKRKMVHFSKDMIGDLLGVAIGQKNIQDLTRLGFEIDGDTATAPSWRFDVETQADMAEEVVRLIGLNTIKPQSLSKKRAQGDNKYAEKLSLKHRLSELGYSETLTYSFTADGRVTIENPRTDEQRALRTTLQYGLLQTLAKNPFLSRARFFEFGNVFLPEETEMLGLVVSGLKEKNRDGVAAELEDALGVKIDLHVVDQPTLEKYEVKQGNVYWTEVPLRQIKNGHPYIYQNLPIAPYSQISKYPPVVRDVTLLIDQDINVKSILDCAKESDALLLIELIDRYNSENLGIGKSALTFRLFFQDLKRSLTDSEASIFVDQIFQRLKDKVEFEVR